MRTVCKPYAWWLDLIRKEEPFTFTRFGDGELNGMFWVGRKKGGGRQKNGDGHTLRNPQMRDELREAAQVNAPNYYRSLWMDDQCQPMERLARDHLDTLAPHGVWYNALAIQDKLNAGRGFGYFQAMRKLKMPIVMIGPEHLRNIDKAGCFRYAGFVQIPPRNAYFAKERIIEEALSYCPAPCFYSIHAGPPAPVIAWELWKARGDECIIFDIGSVLDGYCHPKFGGPGGGKLTRKFWKYRATKRLLKRNLRGK